MLWQRLRSLARKVVTVGGINTGAGFQNPLLGADYSLAVPQIQSPNFITGVSGWIIRKDGTAEFASGLFRGELVAVNGNKMAGIVFNTPSGDPVFVINPDTTFFDDGLIEASNVGNQAVLTMTNPIDPAFPNAFATLRLDNGNPGTLPAQAYVFSESQSGPIMVSGVWTGLSFNAGYSNLTAAGGTGFNCEYRMLNDDTVELRGTMHKGTGAGGAGANGFAGGDTPITLPAAIRPAEQIQYAGGCQSRAANFGTYRMQISAAGNMSFQTSAAHDPGWVSIDGWRYSLT